MLVLAKARHLGELVSDFQRFYGLDALQIGDSITLTRAVLLVTGLQWWAESALMRVLDSRRKWDSTQYLLAIACDRLAVLNWQLGGEKPVELPRPSEAEPVEDEPITRGEIDRILSGKREEVWI